MDWKQLISLKPVICQLLKSNNCWFWGDQLSGLRLEFKLFWGRNQFEHGPYSIQIQIVFRRKTAWKRFESSLKPVMHVNSRKNWRFENNYRFENSYFLKTVMNPDNWSFRGTSYPDSVWKQLWIENSYADRKQLFVSYWIRITVWIRDQLSGWDQIRITT